MQNTLAMLLGAALVALGVLAAALADRIRGLRIAREATPSVRSSRVPADLARSLVPPSIAVVDGADLTRLASKPARPGPAPKSPACDGGEDVIAALVTAGYKKAFANEAAWACTAAERASVESWTASALRRCARGVLA